MQHLTTHPPFQPARSCARAQKQQNKQTKETLTHTVEALTHTVETLPHWVELLHAGLKYSSETALSSLKRTARDQKQGKEREQTNEQVRSKEGGRESDLPNSEIGGTKAAKELRMFGAHGLDGDDGKDSRHQQQQHQAVRNRHHRRQESLYNPPKGFQTLDDADDAENPEETNDGDGPKAAARKGKRNPANRDNEKV